MNNIALQRPDYLKHPNPNTRQFSFPRLMVNDLGVIILAIRREEKLTSGTMVGIVKGSKADVRTRFKLGCFYTDWEVVGELRDYDGEVQVSLSNNPSSNKGRIENLGFEEILKYLETESQTREFSIFRRDQDPVAQICRLRGADSAFSNWESAMAECYDNPGGEKEVYYQVKIPELYGQVMRSLHHFITGEYKYKFTSTQTIEGVPTEVYAPSVTAHFLKLLFGACVSEGNASPVEDFLSDL